MERGVIRERWAKSRMWMERRDGEGSGEIGWKSACVSRASISMRFVNFPDSAGEVFEVGKQGKDIMSSSCSSEALKYEETRF